MILDKVIIALDQMTKAEIDLFLTHKGSRIKTVKIGLELYLKYGNALVKDIQSKYNKDIFLDLKLHDIPVTVEHAIASLESLPISFLTIHLTGGEEMVKKSVIQARKYLPQCKILGVSFLTSLTDLDLKETFGIENLDVGFERLIKIANNSGVDGIVSSPKELSLLRSYSNLIKVTPGIRFKDEIESGDTQDQKRVTTPQLAIENGADFLVIGRSLTKTDRFNERISQLC